MIWGRLISTCAAVFFMGIWTVLTVLQFGHQLGHVVSGCSHHAHHGVHAHHHASCTVWEGTHEDTQFSEHLHVCEVCGWDWAPEGPHPALEDLCSWIAHEGQSQVWPVLQAAVLPHERLTEPDRGPPAVG
ncbi:MAG: hypothetical protein ACPGYM_08610 [Flavobacteriales bacterium]